jgi:hypothetical protein
MTLEHLYNNLKSIDVRKIAFDVLHKNNNLEELEGVQKSQLWAGRDLEGNLLKPSIYDDPYFTKEAGRRNDFYKRKGWKKRVAAGDLAKQWANYKDKQTQHGNDAFFGIRPHGTANLIFTSGKIVWNEIKVVPFGDNDLRITTEFGIQMELENKYGEVFGLNPQGAEYALKTFFLDEFCAEFEKQLLG